MNGGVLAYRKNGRSLALWERWESEYAKVMASTRREQPVLQKALAWAESNVEDFDFVKLPRTFNCRGATSCGLVTNKAGEDVRCLLLHGHGAAAAFGGGSPLLDEEARAAALLDASKPGWPRKGGALLHCPFSTLSSFGPRITQRLRRTRPPRDSADLGKVTRREER